MKKNAYIITFALLSNLNIFAQDSDNKKVVQAFNYIVSVCVNDGMGKDSINSADFISNSDAALKEIKNQIRNKKIDKAEKLLEEFNIYKKNNINDFKSLEILSGFIENDLFFNNRYEKIKSFKINRESRWISFQNKFKKGIDKIKSSSDTIEEPDSSSVENTNDTTSLTEDGTPYYNNDNEYAQDKNETTLIAKLLPYLGYMIALILLICLILVSIRMKNIEKKYKHYKEKASESRRSSDNNMFSNYTNNNELLKLKSDNENLKRTITDLQSQLINSNQKQEDENILNEIAKTETNYHNVVNDNNKLIWVLTLNSDNFLEEILIKEEAYYQLEVKSPTEGEITFIATGENLSTALSYPHEFINPLCTAINAFTLDADSIITTKTGKAQKRNGKWFLIDKIQIKYN